MIEFNKKYTWKQLCNEFDVQAVEAGYKTRQLELMRKLYEIEYIKNAHKYIVRRELTEEEMLMNEFKGKYQKIFELVLGDVLCKKEKNYHVFSMIELLTETKMINDDFSVARYNINAASEILDVMPDELEMYIEESYSLLRRLVRDMLNTLEDKNLIKINSTFKIFKHTKENYFVSKVVPLESPIIGDIMTIENDIIKDMGYDSINELYKHRGRINELYKRSKKEFRQRFDGWEGYYKVYHISIDRKHLKRNTENIYKELNDKIKNKIKNAASLQQLIQLDLMIDATIDSDRPYKLKENIHHN